MDRKYSFFIDLFCLIFFPHIFPYLKQAISKIPHVSRNYLKHDDYYCYIACGERNIFLWTYSNFNVCNSSIFHALFLAYLLSFSCFHSFFDTHEINTDIRRVINCIPDQRSSVILPYHLPRYTSFRVSLFFIHSVATRGSVLLPYSTGWYHNSPFINETWLAVGVSVSRLIYRAVVPSNWPAFFFPFSSRSSPSVDSLRKGHGFHQVCTAAAKFKGSFITIPCLWFPIKDTIFFLFFLLPLSSLLFNVLNTENTTFMFLTYKNLIFVIHSCTKFAETTCTVPLANTLSFIFMQ